MQLTKIQCDIVSLVRKALNPSMEGTVVSLASWPTIEQELSNQAIQTLPVEVISNLSISDAEKKAYTVTVAQSLRSFHNLMLEQEELCGILTDIPFVILKGAAAAMYYERPEYRQMGDIDILIEPDSFDEAVDILNSNGYKQEGDCGRHVGFKSPAGIEIELHRHFSSSDNTDQNDELDQMLLSAINNRESHDIYEYTFPTLPRLENGLVLLAHINHHLTGGLGLRQIIDWMMYVREVLSDSFWHDCFSTAADAIGMRTLAETTTLLCKKYFGLQNVTWCDCADDDLADEMLGYLFDKGNFGRKQEYSSNATVSTLHHLQDPKAAFRYLTAGGMIHWKAAQKYKVLRPFAWIYQICHLVHMGIRRRVGMNVFSSEMRKSMGEADFLSRLGVTKK